MAVWREIDGQPQKRCPTCEARGREPWHPYGAFGKDARRKNSLTIRCRACNREDSAAWAVKYPDHYAAHVARSVQWTRDNPARARDIWRRYYERHKEARKAVRKPRRRPTRWTPELLAEIRAHVAAGGHGAASRLARRLGISRQRVSQLLHEARVLCAAPDYPQDE